MQANAGTSSLIKSLGVGHEGTEMSSLNVLLGVGSKCAGSESMQGRLA